MQAWESLSTTTMSSTPASAGMMPVLARYPEPNTHAASAPFSFASFASSSANSGWLPVTSLDAPAPTPYFSVASTAAALIAWCWLRFR